MRELNKYWLVLIIFGVLFLAFIFAFGIFQSLDPANTGFRENIVNFNSNVLVPENLRNHLN